MSRQLDSVIQERLHHWLLPNESQAVTALVDDEVGWNDLRNTLLNLTGGDLDDIATALDSVLADLPHADVDWITGDVAEGEGAKNPATFLSTLIQDHHEVDWAWDKDDKLT